MIGNNPKKYVVQGVVDNGVGCPLCIDPPAKERRPTVFTVYCEGGYTGPVCAGHLAVLVRQAEGMQQKPAEPKPEPRPAVPVAAVAK